MDGTAESFTVRPSLPWQLAHMAALARWCKTEEASCAAAHGLPNKDKLVTVHAVKRLMDGFMSVFQWGNGLNVGHVRLFCRHVARARFQ